MNEPTRPLPAIHPEMTPREQALLHCLRACHTDPALPADVRLQLWTTMKEIRSGFDARGRLYRLTADADARVAILRVALLAKLAERSGTPLAELLAYGDASPEGQLKAIVIVVKRLQGERERSADESAAHRRPEPARGLASWDDACDALPAAHDAVTTSTMAVRFATDAWIQLGWPAGTHPDWRPQITLGRRSQNWQTPHPESRPLDLESWSAMAACIAGLVLVEALCAPGERRERLAEPLRWTLAQLAAERIGPQHAIAVLLGVEADGHCADRRLEPIREAWERGARRATFVVVVAVIDRLLGRGGEPFAELPEAGTRVDVVGGADPLPGGGAGIVIEPPAAAVAGRRWWWRRRKVAAQPLAHVRIGGRDVAVAVGRLRAPGRPPLV